ncbi:hypothetical protein ACKWTF_015787 [Chironomus riparius]
MHFFYNLCNGFKQILLFVIYFYKAAWFITYRKEGYKAFIRYKELLSEEVFNSQEQIIQGQYNKIIYFYEDGGINIRIFSLSSYIQINWYVLKLIFMGKAVSFKPKDKKLVKVKIPEQKTFDRFRNEFAATVSTSYWTTDHHEPAFVNGYCEFIVAVDDIGLSKIKAAKGEFGWNNGFIVFENFQ